MAKKTTETPKHEIAPKPTAPGTYVRIVETANGKVHSEMGPMSESKAERVERGAMINMNHERFHTDVFTVD
jgi:hypothetical protein